LHRLKRLKLLLETVARVAGMPRLLLIGLVVLLTLRNGNARQKRSILSRRVYNSSPKANSFESQSNRITKEDWLKGEDGPAAVTELDNTSASVAQVLLRALYLFCIFQPILWTAPLAALFSWFRRNLWYNLLFHTLASSGAALIKWGQWTSTRPDMFSAGLCKALSRLHDGAKAHSLAITESQIAKELECSIDDAFDSFEYKPVASGSIAQVYRAKLNGEDVAVKVRHPGVTSQIQIDFRIMKVVASILDSLPGLGWLNLEESMLQFSHTIASQTNLVTEGSKLHLFNKNFRNSQGIGFPVPIVLTESVLIESFEEGISVAEFTDLYRKKERSYTDPEVNLAIIAQGENMYLKMLLEDNLMHADLHPGNILVQEMKKRGRGRQKNAVRIILVDAGMTAVLSEAEQQNFIGLLEAMGEGGRKGGTEAAHYLLNFTSSPAEYSAEQINQFTKDVSEFFAESCGGYFSGMDMGNVLRGILGFLREHRISIDANYATLVMNALCLDGLAKELIPSYRVLDAAKPLLRAHRLSKRLPLGRTIFRIVIPAAKAIKNHLDKRDAVSVRKKYDM
jgi:aarF domain-containing kinase